MIAFNALVLAGSRGGVDPVAAAAGVSAKALATIAGEPMLTRVVRALRDAGAGRIAVSTSDPAVAALAGILGATALESAAGPSRSAGEGLTALGAPLLLTTADHALLQPGWVRHLIDARAPDSDVSVLLARRAAV